MGWSNQRRRCCPSNVYGIAYAITISKHLEGAALSLASVTSCDLHHETRIAVAVVSKSSYALRILSESRRQGALREGDDAEFKEECSLRRNTSLEGLVRKSLARKQFKAFHLKRLVV